MMDLKALKVGLDQLEEEKRVPREKILSAIEDALVAAYKKDYGKKGQIIRAKFDLDSGATDFSQIKIVVDETSVRPPEEDGGEETAETLIIEKKEATKEDAGDEGAEILPRFNEEHHIWLEDARKIKKDANIGEELIFPLETKDDYGRIAAQTAKQVIIQRIREAEKETTLDEYREKEGEILSGIVQKVDRGNVFVDLGRTVAIIMREDQIAGEFYRPGERIRAYLYQVEETPRGINLRLSRSHPQFIARLFETEAPEISSGVVEIKAIAREAGARSKVAVMSHNASIDPVGSCVGQKGSRVSTVINELGGEKIDIIEWSEDEELFISNALSPAKVLKIELDEENHEAQIEVAPDQFSLAVGKGGQNARLAAKLTGWKIDISTPEGTEPEGLKIQSEIANSPEDEEFADGGNVDDGSE
ncbi:MAG TPA: transcription termination factor NusA [Candidatus Paceibacterota bacterium]|jgi:N utilization substance protein A|nr:transcription termination factor NusA [Candidatus Paceibacterota bacterium]HPY13254.1 transcription termination factor NusA [Candidatus Paceibacterota bacterium]